MARILIGNIKGPKGDTGPQGEQGPVGPQGPQGPLPPLVNNALSTEAGVAALDAVMGKTLQDQITQVNSDLSSVSDELETVTANLSDVEAQAEAHKYIEDETDHSETVYSLFKNSISYWGNFHNLTYHFRISDNADSTFGNGHFVAYIFRDNAGAVFSAFIINKWTADAWSMIFTSYDEAKYIKKLS